METTTPLGSHKPTNTRLPGKHVFELTDAQSRALIPRLMAKVQAFDKPANAPVTGQCILWTGATRPDGYGMVRVGGRSGHTINAHRAAWLAIKGPIPQGYELDHLCRVKACVNVAHLEVVTGAENRRRQAAAITHCPQGHEYNEENTLVRIGSDGYRRRKCRACHRAHSAAYKARKAAEQRAAA